MQLNLSYIAGGNAKRYSHFAKEFGNFLQSKTHLLCILGVSYLSTYTKETKIYVNAKVCTGSFIAVLFIIDKNENHPNVHSDVNE